LQRHVTVIFRLPDEWNLLLAQSVTTGTFASEGAIPAG
jgi:hypothetical protein